MRWNPSLQQLSSESAKPNKKCTHCGRIGHLLDYCYDAHPELRKHGGAAPRQVAHRRNPHVVIDITWIGGVCCCCHYCCCCHRYCCCCCCCCCCRCCRHSCCRCCCCYCCCFYFWKLIVILLRWAITLRGSVGDHEIYPTAMTSSGDVAADVGCHRITQRKRKVAEISKFENSIWAFSNCDAFFWEWTLFTEFMFWATQ